ncbi:hypothetical protein HER32_13115 [Hymenobacter sp. BT18]|uniref:hypothetical protein n=1 Tax=Hymenobacter sp. BT18 TaxID=2835648 RepID=UPI00143EE7E4|nr:hypothetical protein [Hymenobacter sp. BT18]QIX62075.1 hypothetical protein HER32_13115 [Hymenobacter sp. BT18]
MRYLILFLFCWVPLRAWAQMPQVLQRPVPITADNQPLSTVLRQLSRQGGVSFSYSSTVLPLQTRVTIPPGPPRPLYYTLDAFCRPLRLSYAVVEGQIVLWRANDRPPAGLLAGAGIYPKPLGPPAPPRQAVPLRPLPTRRVGVRVKKYPLARQLSTTANATASVAATPVPDLSGPTLSAADTINMAADTAAYFNLGNIMAKAQQTLVAMKRQAQIKGRQLKTTAQRVAAVPPMALSPDSARWRQRQARASRFIDSLTVSIMRAKVNLRARDTTLASTAVRPPRVANSLYDEHTWQITLVPPLGTNGLRAGRAVNRYSANVLVGYAAGLRGLELGTVLNLDRDTVRGSQLAGVGNLAGRHLGGLQGAGVLNVVGGGGRGLQLAGVLNIAARPLAGWQAAGVLNYAGPPRPDATEPAGPLVQTAGVLNVSLAEVRGVQAAGVLNVARRVRGVQLGLFNVADTVTGASVGLLNFVRHGYYRLDVLYSETWPALATLKLGGSAWFYTQFVGAAQPFDGQLRWGLGYGLGTELAARRRFSLSLDALALHVNEEPSGWTKQLNLQSQLRLLVGWALWKGGRIRLVAGPEVNVLVSQRYDADRQAVYSQVGEGQHLLAENLSGSTLVRVWAGYSAGLRF